MSVLRDKLFLACFIVAFALVPGWAQMGGLQQPGFPGTSPFPGLQTKAGLSGVITGSVRTLDNRPVPNARVEIDSLVQGQPLAAQYTSSDGSFTLSNLPAGNDAHS